MALCVVKTKDLYGRGAYFMDERNPNYFVPHDNLTISPAVFAFDKASPTLLKIDNLAKMHHINYYTRDTGW